MEKQLNTFHSIVHEHCRFTLFHASGNRAFSHKLDLLKLMLADCRQDSLACFAF